MATESDQTSYASSSDSPNQTSSVSSSDSPDQTSSASSNDGPQVKQIEPLKLPTFEEIRGQEMWNNCAVRSVFSGVVGGGLGIFMGLFLGALDNPLMQEHMTARQQFIYTAKQMGSRSWGSAKAFAVMGLIFSGVECAVEKARAKHDTTNTVVAGCVTGGTLSARGEHVRHKLFVPLKAPNIIKRRQPWSLCQMWSKSCLHWVCRLCYFFCVD